MARTPYSAANPWCWSMFTLPILTRPLYSSANSSRTGPIILQGPHHSAQKSTSTGVEAFSTSAAKFSFVKFTMLGAAIIKWESNKTQVGFTAKFGSAALALLKSNQMRPCLQVRQKQPKVKCAPNRRQSHDGCGDGQDGVQCADGGPGSDGRWRRTRRRRR